jgi:hypothetical protein
MVSIRLHVLFTVVAAIVGVSAQDGTFSTCAQTCVIDSCTSMCEVLVLISLRDRL